MINPLRIARSGGAALALLALAAAAATETRADAGWFKGRTVTYIVATAAGGGYDGYGRLTARYLEKYLPGSTFVVVNRPGAGHLIGTNLIYTAKPDGLTLGTFNMGVLYSQLIGAKGARFDLGKMSWIGKATSDKRIIVVGVQSPYKKFEDLYAATGPVPIAVSGVGSAAYTELQLLARVFDLKLRLLSGYSGGDDDMAIMRGEVVGKMGAISGQGGLVRAGKGRFIIQIGGARETGYGEMSYGADVAKTPEQKAVINLIASQGENMRVTAGPPDIPADRLAALHDAYGKAFADPDLLADARKLHYAIDPGVGEDVARGVRASLEQPPRIRAMLQELYSKRPAGIKVSGALVKVLREGRVVHFRDEAGKELSTKLSGSRTKVEIAGKDSVRANLKPGMACAITYTGPGTEAMLVACK
jgi:tripartite-type tricarboxylate transporter receptor subunit TctC